MSAVGVAVVLGTLVLATAVGLLMRTRAGRVRGGGTAAGGWLLAGRVPRPPESVLLLQLSSPVCTPCRQTAALLAELSARRPELVHVEVDLADRPELAGTLNVMRTPTVVAFDRAGAELVRVSGVPRVARSRGRAGPGHGALVSGPAHSVVGWSRNSGFSATLGAVFWPLTRRRAVDLCRVGSCLCRIS